MKNMFFNATPLLKEYLVLDIINKNKNITQREISNEVKISLSMVNQYLTEYENKGYLIRNYISVKNVEYFLTDKGKERMKVLNIGYLSYSQSLYKKAKEETKAFIDEIVNKGFVNLIFYGAGEVAEIMLQTINDDHTIPIKVVGVIDDNIDKQGSVIVNNIIKDNSIINNTKHDAIMIASYNHHEGISFKLKEMNYPSDKIVYFFN